MYSERFVEEVLAASGLGTDSVVLDPWLGVGTTTAVAARSGIRAVGFDINPAMVATVGTELRRVTYPDSTTPEQVVGELLLQDIRAVFR
jgi:tRNA G10  N-methylase Trm11